MNKAALKSLQKRMDKHLISSTKKLITKLLEIKSVKLLEQKAGGINSRGNYIYINKHIYKCRCNITEGKDPGSKIPGFFKTMMHNAY